MSALLTALSTLLMPWERLLRVSARGLDRIPNERPLMFVGNHQLLASDVPFLMSLLSRRKAITLRPLADDFFFRHAPVAALVRAIGAERADPDICRRLLSDGDCVLVYPGGAREAAKGEGQPYRLEWWDRLGFARVAIEHGCAVVPVAAAGIDDSVRILVDRTDYLNSPLGPWIDRLQVRHDLLPPLFYPRSLPRLTFAFASPIRPGSYAGHDPETAARMLRADVATAIGRELRQLVDTPTREAA